jgi:hypothetical protein
LRHRSYDPIVKLSARAIPLVLGPLVGLLAIGEAHLDTVFVARPATARRAEPDQR